MYRKHSSLLKFFCAAFLFEEKLQSFQCIPLFPPQAAHYPQQLLHIEAAVVLRRLFVGRRRRRTGRRRRRRQGHTQTPGQLLSEGRRQQRTNAAHVLLHAQSAPLRPDLLRQHQGAGQRVRRRRGRPRGTVGSVLIHKSVHTSILCAPPLPCHRATFRTPPHRLKQRG